MLDLTPEFNALLKGHEAPPTSGSYSLDQIDEFLKEAYRINSHITTLHTQLQDVRQAYLSTAQPRKTHLRSRPDQQQPLYLTDQQREEIDADAKRLLRDLNASIRGLADAEELYQETQQVLIKKKYASALAGLGSWATGGTGLAGKSPEQEEVEERLLQLATHREGVLWFLRQRLQLCGQTQQSMMQTRLTREMEKNRSVLAKAKFEAKLGAFQEAALNEPGSPTRGQHRGPRSLRIEEEERATAEGLTDEQLQMFEKDNQDMLKHYESTLDKVITAEKSLIEISELQTLLVNNLEIQAEHVEQLVADSVNTTQNVDKGNRELKKALDRPSTARYTFFAATGLCMFVIVWDFFV